MVSATRTINDTIDKSNVLAELELVDRLRADIVNGAFCPGDRLKFATLSERYDVGFGSLRETLSQLATEGFATQETNKGFAVAPVSERELLEITKHYIELEQRAIASAITNGDDSWEANIVAAHHRLLAIEKQPWEERVARHTDWVIRHREFHASLVAACEDTWLLRLRTLMFDQLDRYRFLTKMAASGIKGKGGSRSTEHRRIMESILNRDIEKSSTLIEQHIQKTAARAAKLLVPAGEIPVKSAS